MPERPYIFGGMPIFLGYYWRDENFRPNGDVLEDDNPFTFWYWAFKNIIWTSKSLLNSRWTLIKTKILNKICFSIFKR